MCQINSIIKCIIFSISHCVTGVGENCQSIFYSAHANYALVSFKNFFFGSYCVDCNSSIRVCVAQTYCSYCRRTNLYVNAIQFAF